MPCKVSDINLAIPPSPISIPGFGQALSLPIPQIPIPGLELPELPDIADLMEKLRSFFPSGDFLPNLDAYGADIMKALASIFNQIAPYLSFYKFIQALLNIILCVIDIFCSLPHPYKMLRALRRLFKQCLPPFLALFPFLALLAMIIALLLLIWEFIKYIVNAIIALIKAIIENFKVLAMGLGLQDEEATLKATIKIARLLCIIKNIVALLTAIAAIIAIVQALAELGGRGLCSKSAGSDCCDDESCPPFIANNENGLFGVEGTLRYYKQINTDTENLLNIPASAAAQFNLPPLRPESWQFYDNSTNQVYSFRDIITPINGQIYYPDGVVFDKNTNPSKAPYLLDITMFNYDPKKFIPSDVAGARTFKLTDLIVVKKPYIGVFNKDNVLDLSINADGTLALAGGKVFTVVDGVEEPYMVNGTQATIETFMHEPALYGDFPTINDGYIVNDIEFNLRYNYEALIDYQLITAGCDPTISAEAGVINAKFDMASVFDKIGDLPDPNAAQACILAAQEKLNAEITEATLAEYQATVEACLGKFADDTLAAMCRALKAGVSPYNTRAVLDTDIQFITRPITVSIEMKDANDTVISSNIPEEIANNCLTITGNATFGELGEFIYDGYSKYVAELRSPIPGKGVLTIDIEGETLKTVINSDDVDAKSAIEIVSWDYMFVSTSPMSLETTAIDEQGIRRDVGDISRDAGET